MKRIALGTILALLVGVAHAESWVWGPFDATPAEKVGEWMVVGGGEYSHYGYTELECRAIKGGDPEDVRYYYSGDAVVIEMYWFQGEEILKVDTPWEMPLEARIEFQLPNDANLTDSGRMIIGVSGQPFNAYVWSSPVQMYDDSLPGDEWQQHIGDSFVAHDKLNVKLSVGQVYGSPEPFEVLNEEDEAQERATYEWQQHIVRQRTPWFANLHHDSQLYVQAMGTTYVKLFNFDDEVRAKLDTCVQNMFDLWQGEVQRWVDEQYSQAVSGVFAAGEAKEE